MPEDIIQQTDDEDFSTLVRETAEYLDYVTFNKISKKLTDYSGVMTSGKLSGIVNFNFRLNSIQTEKIIELLVRSQGLSRVFNLALKGSRDLEPEYISNIFSDTLNLETLSSYISLRNILENRLSQQTQQYNMNMGKTNTTLAMPVNELRGHAKTYRDLTENKLSVSTKAQHGMIAASLHDAYITILNRADFKNDRSYMKFFFNDDDSDRRSDFVLRKGARLLIPEVQDRIAHIVDSMTDTTFTKNRSRQREAPSTLMPSFGDDTSVSKDTRKDSFVDRMLQTPFGKQYGARIDSIIMQIFDPSGIAAAGSNPDEDLRRLFSDLLERYNNNRLSDVPESLVHEAVTYLLGQNFGMKAFAERFLHAGRKELFGRFYSPEVKENIDQFSMTLFIHFFETKFGDVFRIIKSVEMKKFACAYIIKRIYMKQGENMTNFGYFLVRAIARAGNIKLQ